MLKKINVGKVYLFLLAFMGLFIFNLFVPLALLGLNSYTARMWVMFQIFVSLIALVILVKEKLPSKKIIILSVFLGVLSGLLTPRVSITTCITFMASLRIFEKFGTPIRNIKKSSTTSILISIGLGIGVGISLGLVNILLSGKAIIGFNPNITHFLRALNPAIFEEISFRMFMYAVILYLFNGHLISRMGRVLSYVSMIVPHVLIHMPDMFFKNGMFAPNIAALFINFLMVSLIFALPFTLLQRKRDLLSAMVAHGLVDFIRFGFFNI